MVSRAEFGFARSRGIFYCRAAAEQQCARLDATVVYFARVCVQGRASWATAPGATRVLANTAV
eukprot:6340546-Pyramimonas_sp.AAC.1